MSDFEKGDKVKGSEDDPRYLVESDKTGKRAAHTGASSTKR